MLNIRRRLIERFWSQVGRGSGCWIWRGSTVKNGYGRTRLAGERGAHRVAWMLSVGPIPKGMLVLHRCDNPPCCNPEHLWLGTHADNVADRDAKGRQSKGENHWSHLHPETNQGISNGQAKLTDAQVKGIRCSMERHRDIAARYGVSRALVSMIRSRKLWRHLNG